MASSSSMGGNLPPSDAVANNDNRANSKSSVVLNRADDFFNVRAQDLSWSDHFELALSPSSVITGHSIVFEVPRLSHPNFVYAGDLQLQCSVTLTDASGQKPADDALVSFITIAGSRLFTSFLPQVSVVNNIGAALFRSVRIFVGDVEVSSSPMDTYAIRHFLDTALNYSHTKKTASLQLYGWYQVRPPLLVPQNCI